MAIVKVLKLVGYQKEGGSGRWQMIGIMVSGRGDRGVFAFEF